MNSGARGGVAFAIVAHPDDVEFYMAGTLLLLKQAGLETHYLSVASGSCGSATRSRAAITRIRRGEARAAARILGAHHHDSLVDDLEIFYEPGLLRRLAALVREVKPAIVLTHSPEDYMEDHMNCCRLAVTAAFARGMPNFRTQPPRRAIDGEVTVYHAMPHGLRDPLRRKVVPEAFVDTTPVHDLKAAALAAHESQRGWLDSSQGMDSYVRSMEQMSLEVGRMSGKFRHAEAWRRRLHLGFCDGKADPLRSALGARYKINRAYEGGLG